MTKIENIIHNDEVIYLKKDFLGYRVIEPLFDPETKKIIWKNMITKRGLVTLGIVIFFLAIFYLALNEQITNYRTVLSDPCQYCSVCNPNRLLPENSSLTLLGEMNQNG